MRRIIFLVVLVSMSSLVMAPAVLAAPPTNDTYAGRTVIGSTPFSTTQDTTEATTDADDAELNQFCGAPATDASVWFEYTAAAEEFVTIDVSASDYSAGVLVGTGSPGSLEILACGPGGTQFIADAGVAYVILAIDDQDDGSGNGGLLDISIESSEVPPAPEVSLTVDSVAAFNKDGTATLSGTITCTGEAEFTFMEASLTQRVGRFSINGFGYSEFDCDGETHDWSITIWSSNGLYKGGKATASVYAEACGFFSCGSDYVEKSVQLRK
jgi:hypothetical protein